MRFKIVLLIAGVLTAPAFLLAQSAFSKLSFEKAIEKAAAENKLLWVQMDSKDCEQCNDVADKALDNLELIGYIQNNFIAIRPKAGKNEWQILVDSFKAPTLGVAFFDAQKSLVYKSNGSTSGFTKYVNDGKVAKVKATMASQRHTEISKLEKDTSLPGRLKKLELEIEIQAEQNMPADILLEQFCDLLPSHLLKVKSTIQTIMKGSPVLGTRPDSIARANKDLFNQAWYEMDLQKRILINQRITNNTIQKAVVSKNESLAFKAANFARGVNDNQEAGQVLYYKTMNSYHLGVKDTLRYLQNLSGLMNNAFLRQNPIAVKLEDSLRRINANFLTPDPNWIGDTVREKSKIIVTTRVTTFRPKAQAIASELNSAAWDVYKMSRDTIMVMTALKWAAHALSFAETPEITDTYARLLYKIGRTNEAVAKEERAIELLKIRNSNTSEYEAVLAKMKKVKPID